MVITAVFDVCFHGNGLSLYLFYVSKVTDLFMLQDFAETTMNELLGWYGYDKVDEGDTEKLDLQQFAPSAGRGENYHPSGGRGENYAPSGGRNSVLTPSEQRERDSSSRNSVDSVGQISSDGSSGTVGLHSIRISTSQLAFYSHKNNVRQHRYSLLTLYSY